VNDINAYTYKKAFDFSKAFLLILLLIGNFPIVNDLRLFVQSRINIFAKKIQIYY